jgi:hypothetical protein
MNEINFRDIKPIENYNIRFKCFDGSDDYQAVFYVCSQNDESVRYKINFEISRTRYNSEINNSGKSAKIYIDERFGNLEKCFEEVGHKYLMKKISTNELKNETLSLLNNLSL